MAWDDIVGKFEPFTNPAPDAAAPDIDTILAGVSEVYTQDISIRDAAVQDRENAIAELTKEKESLMLKNYELLMKHPAGNVGGDNGNPPEPTESERAASVTFADIFKKN